MADPNNTIGEPPREIHVEKKPTNWLAWAALALGILALLLALSHCNRAEPVAVTNTIETTEVTNTTTPAVPVEKVVLPGGKSIDLAPATLNYELQKYLASGAPAPRKFTFDKLNFDTGSSVIKVEDQPTIDALGQIMTAYPKANIKLIGFTDSTGAAGTNAKLGEERAQSVAKALTGHGIDAKRIATGSGAATDPVGSNATSGGRAENRRTDLEVTAK